MNESKDQSREAYQKPRLGVIDLKTDEVLGAGCKTTGSSASGFTPCSLANCNQDGS